MGLKSETRCIDGIDITVTQLPALRSFALMARLGKILAPALGKAKGLSLDADISTLGPVLAELFARLDGDEAQALARTIFSSAEATTEDENGRLKRIPLDDDRMINLVFGGKIRTFIGALKFALEVNFADFFAGAPELKPDARQKADKSSTSTTTSQPAGPPGGSG